MTFFSATMTNDPAYSPYPYVDGDRWTSSDLRARFGISEFFHKIGVLAQEIELRHCFKQLFDKSSLACHI